MVRCSLCLSFRDGNLGVAMNAPVNAEIRRHLR